MTMSTTTATVVRSAAISVAGLRKSYGRQARAGRDRPGGRRGHRLRVARAERRRQDDDGAHPVHADPGRRRCGPASTVTTCQPTPTAVRGVDRCHRPVLGRRRSADRRGEPRPDGRPAPPRPGRRPAPRSRAAASSSTWSTMPRDRPRRTPGGMRRRLDLAMTLVGRPARDLPGRARPPGWIRAAVGPCGRSSAVWSG